MSKEEFERTIPVRPPMVKRKINPRAQIMGVSYLIRDPWIVANHLNTLIPVGTAIIMVAAVK
jgi:hypothetical protein